MLLAWPLSMCQKYNHNYHEDTSWQPPRRTQWSSIHSETWGGWHRWPAAPIVSCTSDFWAWKSGCNSRIHLLQQSYTTHFLPHFAHISLQYRPHSVSTVLIPFGILGWWGWEGGYTIVCVTFSPSEIYQMSCMHGWFPPGLTFIQVATKAFFLYVEWPCELLTMIKVLKRNIGRCYSDLKLNVPTRNCIGSLRSQDLCKWYHTNCGLVMRSSQSY